MEPHGLTAVVPGLPRLALVSRDKDKVPEISKKFPPAGHRSPLGESLPVGIRYGEILFDNFAILIGVICRSTFRRISILGLVVLWMYPASAQAALNLDGAAADQYDSIRVDRVLNTDTIVLENGETVKLIGVRAFGDLVKRKKVERDERGFVVPERVRPEVSLEEQAFQFVQELLEGKDVRLEFDVAPKDEGYRTLAYVFVIEGNVFANAEILRRGFGDLHIQPPNMKYAQQLRAAYREAGGGMNE